MCACVCVPFVFLHIPECVSAVFDLSISDDKYSKTRDRHRNTFPAHLQTDMIRGDIMISYSRMYHPS